MTNKKYAVEFVESRRLRISDLRPLHPRHVLVVSRSTLSQPLILSPTRTLGNNNYEVCETRIHDASFVSLLEQGCNHLLSWGRAVVKVQTNERTDHVTPTREAKGCDHKQSFCMANVECIAHMSRGFVYHDRVSSI